MREAGHDQVFIITDVKEVGRKVTEITPDVVMIDPENPNRDMLEHYFSLSRMLQKPILDMAISRFNAFFKLTRELEEARSELEVRKILDQAKGFLSLLDSVLLVVAEALRFGAPAFGAQS